MATLELTQSIVTNDGTKISLTFTESVSFSSGGNDGFVLDASGGSTTATVNTNESSGANLVLDLGRRIDLAEQSVELSYTQPGDGLQNSSSEDADSFELAIKNGSFIDASLGTATATGTNWKLVHSYKRTRGSVRAVRVKVDAASASAAEFYVDRGFGGPVSIQPGVRLEPGEELAFARATVSGDPGIDAIWMRSVDAGQASAHYSWIGG